MPHLSVIVLLTIVYDIYSCTLIYMKLFYSSVQEAVEVIQELKNSPLIFIIFHARYKVVLLVDKEWTLHTYWVSNNLVGTTENRNVLAHWATGFQFFFSCPVIFPKEKTTSRGLIDLFSRRAIDFHRQAKPFALNYVIRKTFLWLMKPGGRNHAHSRSTCPVIIISFSLGVPSP